jgi:hypothetical protein
VRPSLLADQAAFQFSDRRHLLDDEFASRPGRDRRQIAKPHAARAFVNRHQEIRGRPTGDSNVAVPGGAAGYVFVTGMPRPPVAITPRRAVGARAAG